MRHPDIDANPVNKTGLTPIIMAIKNGKIKAMEVLVKIYIQTRKNANLFRLCWRIPGLIQTRLMRREEL